MSRSAFVSTLTLLALMAPTAAHAAVVINEIAWMGTSASANAEWIELYNADAAAVALSGWTLVSSSGSPSISLTGSITGNGFFLLERTSDASVPSVSADQIYTGALPNTGVTLTLKDATGAVVDTVSGGTDWSAIGGDNTTKQTPQRSGSSWSTGEPTPRAVNTGGSTGDGADTASSTDPLTPQPSIAGSSVSGGSSANPIRRLYIDSGPGRIVSAGAEVPFTAHAYDSDGSIRTDADLTWSFGDGAGAEGDTVAHTYSLPGTYTVSIHAAAGESEVVSLLSVRAIPVTVEIRSSNEDGIVLKNSSDTLLDLSYWKFIQGDSSFVLPRYTTLRAGQEALFPHTITHLGTSTRETILALPDGRPAQTFSSPTSTTPIVLEEVSGSVAAEEVEEVSFAQPLVDSLGIQEVEEAPSSTRITPNLHDIETRAPSTVVESAVLGASVGLAAPELLTSPWTLSFMGLLVAAASILVIL